MADIAWQVQAGDKLFEYEDYEQPDAVAKFFQLVADNPTRDDGQRYSLTFIPEPVS